MTQIWRILAAIAIVAVVSVMSSCSRTDDLLISNEGEESNVELALNERYDNVRNGARLILDYNAASNAFVGTVENTTNEILMQVRVEVHLSNGVELGPTAPVDLAPGAQIAIELKAEGPAFNKWTAHPEVGPSGAEGSEETDDGATEGSGEHGEGGEHEGGEGD